MIALLFYVAKLLANVKCHITNFENLGELYLLRATTRLLVEGDLQVDELSLNFVTENWQGNFCLIFTSNNTWSQSNGLSTRELAGYLQFVSTLL